MQESLTRALEHDCHGAKLRFQVVKGKLWVDHVTQRGVQGWYPGASGEGDSSEGSWSKNLDQTSCGCSWVVMGAWSLSKEMYVKVSGYNACGMQLKAEVFVCFNMFQSTRLQAKCNFTTRHDVELALFRSPWRGRGSPLPCSEGAYTYTHL